LHLKAGQIKCNAIYGSRKLTVEFMMLTVNMKKIK